MKTSAILTCLVVLAHAALASETAWNPDARPYVAMSDETPDTPLIAVQPLGEPDHSLVQLVAEDVEATFDADVVILPDEPMPANAYYAPRHRYRGDRIIDDLDARTPAAVTKVIALTSNDVSKTKGGVYDWGVIGLASLGGRAAVVSTYRLGRRHVPPGRFATRLARVVEHEIGHTFGLRHCDSARCLMNDACGSIRTVDRSNGAFCGACRERLADVLREPELPAPAIAMRSGVDAVTASTAVRPHARLRSAADLTTR